MYNLKNFRTYNLAVKFHRACKELKLKGDARTQFERAHLSIVLNLAEGRGKMTTKDQKRFYYNALGSLRECQAVLEIEDYTDSKAGKLGDSLGGHLWKLIKNM